MYLYKESEIVNELSLEERKYLRGTNININNDINIILSEIKEYIDNKNNDNESKIILKSIYDKLLKIDMDKYIKVLFIVPPYTDTVLYHAISTIDDIKTGDYVLINKNDRKDEGTVREIGYYKENSLSYYPDEMFEVTDIINE